jgi:hypothetical protein
MQYKKCVLIFSTSLSQKFLKLKKNSARCYCKFTQIFMKSAQYCHILIKIEFLLRDFQKIYTKFHKNSSRGGRVVPHGQTDMTELMVVFRNFAKAPKGPSLLGSILYCNPSMYQGLRDRDKVTITPEGQLCQ